MNQVNESNPQLIVERISDQDEDIEFMKFKPK